MKSIKTSVLQFTKAISFHASKDWRIPDKLNTLTHDWWRVFVEALGSIFLPPMRTILSENGEDQNDMCQNMREGNNSGSITTFQTPDTISVLQAIKWCKNCKIYFSLGGWRVWVHPVLNLDALNRATSKIFLHIQWTNLRRPHTHTTPQKRT